MTILEACKKAHQRALDSPITLEQFLQSHENMWYMLEEVPSLSPRAVQWRCSCPYYAQYNVCKHAVLLSDTIKLPGRPEFQHPLPGILSNSSIWIEQAKRRSIGAARGNSVSEAMNVVATPLATATAMMNSHQNGDDEFDTDFADLDSLSPSASESPKCPTTNVARQNSSSPVGVLSSIASSITGGIARLTQQ